MLLALDGLKCVVAADDGPDLSESDVFFVLPLPIPYTAHQQRPESDPMTERFSCSVEISKQLFPSKSNLSIWNNLIRLFRISD